MDCKTECPYKDIGNKLKGTHADIIVVIDAEKTYCLQEIF